MVVEETYPPLLIIKAANLLRLADMGFGLIDNNEGCYRYLWRGANWWDESVGVGATTN